MSIQDLTEKLQQLQQRPKCPDWGTKIQDVCQQIWLQLDQQQDPSTPEVDHYISLLAGDYEAYAVARLVIPELRNPPKPDERETSSKVRIATDLSIKHADMVLPKLQADFDTPMYRAEKDILLGADLHRARLLLQRSSRPDAEEEDKLAKWFESRPRD